MSEQITKTSTHTPGPWEMNIGAYGKKRVPQWQVVQHKFPKPPYEGDLENEWGIYPPIGEAGPVALVAGEENACVMAAAPELLAASKPFVDPEVHLRFMGDKDGRIYLSVTAEEYAAMKAAIAKAHPAPR